MSAHRHYLCGVCQTPTTEPKAIDGITVCTGCHEVHTLNNLPVVVRGMCCKRVDGKRTWCLLTEGHEEANIPCSSCGVAPSPARDSGNAFNGTRRLT